MRIASIALKDFRVYEQAAVTFEEPLCIIRGHNHAGKSSLAQAVQLSLTRRTDGTDPRGAGANDKIRDGASKAVIDLEVETKKGPVALHVTYGPNKTGRQGGAQDSGFEKYLDANAERLSCVLDAEAFIGLRAEAQKQVLASLVLPQTISIDSEIRELTEKHVGRFAWDNNPVALIDQVYQSAYDARREAKATLGAIVIPSRPVKPEHSTDEIQAKLKQLRGLLAQEQQKAASDISVEIARVEQDISHLERDLAYAQSAYAQAKDAFAAAQEAVLSGSELTKLKKVAAGRKILAVLQEKIAAARREQTTQQGAQEAFESLREEPRCPTCTQAVTKDFLDNKIAEHRKCEERAIEEERRYLAEMKDLGDVAGAERQVAAQDTATQRVLETKRSLTAAEENVKSIDAQIAKAKAVVAEAKAKQPAPVDSSVADDLTVRIEGWERLLGPAAQYEATLKQIESATQRSQEAKAKVESLETLCSYFGKDGVKAKLIQEHIEAFALSVNKVLAAWGYSAALSIDPYEFLVTNSAGSELPLKELSKSEQLMFGAALQCAIAFASKIRMVVIDRADVFVNSERGKLFKVLRSMISQDMLDQAIVLVSDDKSDAPQVNGVAFYQVANGQIERLGQKIEAAA